jgi:hypothetical protein
MSLTVRVVARADEVPPILWSEGFAPPVEGVWWYRGLEQSGLEDQFTFSYAIVEDEGRPVALAPMFIADIPIELVVPAEVMPLFRAIGVVWRGVMHQRTLFVGSPFSDEGTVGFAPGADRVAALIAIARAMNGLARKAGAWMLVWKDFPEAAKGEMEAMARAAGFFPAVSYPGTVAHFPSASMADYEMSLKPSHRHNMRRRRKRSAALVNLDVEVVQHPDAATLDAIYGLFRQTFEKSETQFERLDRRYFEVFAGLPEAWFVLLRAPDDHALVAFMLCLVSGDLVINKFIGIDYARPRDWALYFRLWDEAALWAMARGAKALQSGQTGYRPKVEMGHKLQPLFNYARHRNPLVHAVYALVGKQISWASLDPYLANLEGET